MMAESVNQRWAANLVGALVHSGVRHVVIAPGSRSTPLALAFADRADVRLFPIMDERVAGFFGLGLAKGSEAPVAVLCTSGTAGAHLLPAVIEASEGHAQLIAVTADRPWELHGFGAAQTIDQHGLFGRFVRSELALPAPDDAPDVLRHVAASVAKAVAGGGCLHINAPFREPLAPEEPGRAVDPELTRFVPSALEPDVRSVVALLERAERGLIVCGPRERADGFGDAVHRLGAHLGFVVLAEAASNARFGHPQAISTYDTLWRHERFAASMRPDVVLRFGGGLTAKSMITLSAPNVVQVSEDGRVVDPAHQAQTVIAGDAVRVCEALISATKPSRATAWRSAWLEAEHTVRARLLAITGWGEPQVARDVIASVAADSNVVLSSSMPIRDVDAFAQPGDRPLRVFSNRGVNGIDGVFSTALGIAAATGRPTTLLIGDVALLHDLGGWVAAKTLGLELTVVVVNNDGGGIFHFLPIAERTAHFERLFGTPHGVELAHVAALAGARFVRADSSAALRHAVGGGGGLTLIEVKTNRAENVGAHRALFSQLGEGVA
jgi:2-succinyl-5-enolpyruvyl-6-hydroxy-3-cyclohexene-1-carboxylate synthase